MYLVNFMLTDSYPCARMSLWRGCSASLIAIACVVTVCDTVEVSSRVGIDHDIHTVTKETTLFQAY